MSNNLTFKEYLKSKKALREAVNDTPKQTKEYSVSKYCRLVVGETKDDKTQINLKPSDKMKVEWLYENMDEPTPVSITFEGVCPTIDSETHSTYWQSYKLQRWLLRNTEHI